MKKVLIISSSPRKNGNSQLLCEKFKEGAESQGNEVCLIRLAEKNIGFCHACDACMKNGGICVLQDDMREILEKYKEADVLVLSTPVYFYGISAQMKTFMTVHIQSGSISEKKKYIILCRQDCKGRS